MYGVIARLLILTAMLSLVSCSHKAEQPAAAAASAQASVTEEAKLMQPGVHSVTFFSKSLQQEMRMNVYLPPGYTAESQERYPVLYLLHGYTGNEQGWLPGLGTDQAADALIGSGEIVPLIIVSPQINNSYGINTADTTRRACSSCMDEGRYEDYLYQDVIGYIDSHYPTLADRKNRFIGGLSMGGFASLHLAFGHPELFSKVGGHSPAVWLDTFVNAGGLKAWLYPNETLRMERDPIALAQTKDLQGMRVYLDCGDEDSYRFYEGTEVLYKLLLSRGVTAEYHLQAGKHDGDYWSAHVKDYLLFYAGISESSSGG
ncbi:alpha/beta hydrolase [Paenibacillus hexagrammi]|uniref:Esterase n=1 Tax=Paenibacillus hexagrammi TaxID=2908839 RepID=A0ABY3SHG5_9BACL|nr:alpha/beta hydrolase-fold protein [Paenibacillus sp. YPD9-1]UJF33472.1 esterase [Paenibacillus sp. YPD9-1]